MKRIAAILCILFLLLIGCTTPAPDKAEEEVNLVIPQEATWEQAKEIILAGKVASVTQSHDLQVILDLKDGSQLTTTEPAIDEVFRVVEQCGAKCENIGLMTE